MSLNPAQRLGLDAGRLARGRARGPRPVRPERALSCSTGRRCRSKSKNTPFDGARMQGRVLRDLGRRASGLRRRDDDPSRAHLRPARPDRGRDPWPISWAASPSASSSPGAMGLGDLRKIGSGNIGATNVLRTGNKARGLPDPRPRRGQGRDRGPDRAGGAGRRRGAGRGRSSPSSAISSRCGSGFGAARASRPSSARCWR